MGIIYCYKNKINGKVYVGQTRHTKRRKYEHEYMAMVANIDTPFYHAIRKYGIDNFEYSVLETAPSEELDRLEKDWIQKLNSYGKGGYNMTLGGNGMNGYEAPVEAFICQYCGCEYEAHPSHSSNKWCSEECKYNYDVEHGRRDVTGICSVCGKEYIRYRRLRSDVCSLKCAVERDSNMFTCKHCGKRYKAKDNGNNMFCSKNCKVLYSYHDKRYAVDRLCPVCGKTFKVAPWRKQETCSRGCANKLRKIRADKKLPKQTVS